MFYQLLLPKKLYHLLMAMMAVILRLSWFLLTESECRRFVLDILLKRFPPMDPEVEEVFAKYADQDAVDALHLPGHKKIAAGAAAE